MLPPPRPADPALAGDALPQPFRALDHLLAGIVDAAAGVARARRAQRDLRARCAERSPVPPRAALRAAAAGGAGGTAAPFCPSPAGEPRGGAGWAGVLHRPRRHSLVQTLAALATLPLRRLLRGGDGSRPASAAAGRAPAAARRPRKRGGAGAAGDSAGSGAAGAERRGGI
jgi:hypothetical protein